MESRLVSRDRCSDRSAVRPPPRSSAALVRALTVLFATACASGHADGGAAATAATEPRPAVTGDDGDGGVAAPKSRSMTVLVSRESPSAYCNGERMDSDAYRKTLTREKRIELPPAGASMTELARVVIDSATEGMCQTVMRQLQYRAEGGTLHIPPFDGWAGVSITMCSCQPEVEVNFARIPGVTRVVWDEQ